MRDIERHLESGIISDTFSERIGMTTNCEINIEINERLLLNRINSGSDVPNFDRGLAGQEQTSQRGPGREVPLRQGGVLHL